MPDDADDDDDDDTRLIARVGGEWEAARAGFSITRESIR